MWKQQKFRVTDHSHVGEVRRFAQGLAAGMGFDEIISGKISIVVTELGTNMVKHAKDGEFFVIESPDAIHLLAIDRGPGMNPEVCMSDGFSTQGTAGNGLGAIRRGADFCEIYTVLEKGTVIYARFDLRKMEEKFEVGALCVPFHGEPVSGDGWSFRQSENGFQVILADGLGHGLLAHQASDLATKIFEEEPVKDQENFLNTVHLALRSTRGAAVSLGSLDTNNKVLNFCGVGNVLGFIAGPGINKRCITYNGTLGVQTRKPKSLPYPLEANSYFVIMSDGVSSQASLSGYPGLLHKHPFTVAGVLFRDYGKKTDDSTIVVIREK